MITSIALTATVLIGFAGNASATIFGENITIYDGTEDSTHTGTNIGREDGETEPGMVNSQAWDLEGFFQKGNELSMVGGYNFVTGEGLFESGDIFLSIDDTFGSGAAPSGFVASNGNWEEESNFGYEYVIDLNFSDLNNLTYEVLKLDPTDTTLTAWYPANENDTPGSNPWRYVSGGEQVENGTGTFEFFSGLTNADTGFLGGSHYALTGFDLSFLGIEAEFYSHFTMGCGNDNLLGQGTTAPVPEPATMLLFGTGLVGLAGAYRRKKK